MEINIYDIPNSGQWDVVEPIDKGWSDDKKYYIKTLDQKELLLKISDISQYEQKKREFNYLKVLMDKDIFATCPIDFGLCDGGKSVYSLLSWISGEDAESAILKLSKGDQYRLGTKAGEFLKRIHEIQAPKEQESWEKRYHRKIDSKILSYKNCKIQFNGADQMMAYIERNRLLLKDRPQSFQHGDYHIGNMIITPSRDLGIIDFNRMDFGDPWEEFNRITFSASISPEFASGCINGYFSNEVPDVFFKLMALYIATNQISSIPWTIPFGEEDVNKMLKQAQNVLLWYDNFEKYIPNWYISNI